jgi:hypothetical protein
MRNVCQRQQRTCMAASRRTRQSSERQLSCSKASKPQRSCGRIQVQSSCTARWCPPVAAALPVQGLGECQHVPSRVASPAGRRPLSRRQHSHAGSQIGPMAQASTGSTGCFKKSNGKRSAAQYAVGHQWAQHDCLRAAALDALRPDSCRAVTGIVLQRVGQTCPSD